MTRKSNKSVVKNAIRYSVAIPCLITAAIAIFNTSPLLADENQAIDFGSGNAHVTFANDSLLGLQFFTIETWFKMQGAGSPVSTGSGGINAIPLVTKGRDQGEGNSRDLNYFLGIQESTNVLAADFEDYSSGENHPITGRTALSYNKWYHAAVTYDGSRIRLYLNGILESEVTVSSTPRWDSIQRAALATARNSFGICKGHFDGIMDEVRVWNYARSGYEIRECMKSEVKTASGLIGRWGCNEGWGNIIYSSSAFSIQGSIIGLDWSWTKGAPLETSLCPDEPILNSPLDGAMNIPVSPALSVFVSDPNTANLSVTFYGRKAPSTKTDFTLIALPDTQYYIGRNKILFFQQTQWVVDSRQILNTAFVTHLGDIVDKIDLFKYPWTDANNSMSNLDDVMPYGLAPGNHDMSAEGIAKYYDLYFPSSRYDEYSWYGGSYRDNKNSFELFSVGLLDFIILHLEFNPTDDVLAWADTILKSYPERRAIISTHDYLDNLGNRSTTKQRPDGNSGEEIWQKLIRSNCTVFMVLNGHYHWPDGESSLTSTNDCSFLVHQMLQNYQDRPNGGDGWLRYYTFHPTENRIDAYTYSPTLDEFETDVDSQFSLDYPMGASEFQEIDTHSNVLSGTSISTVWEDPGYASEYEWFVSVDDGTCITTGPVWTFKTGEDCSKASPDDALCDGVDNDCDALTDENYVSTPTSCGLGECAGNTGQLLCQNGKEINTCDPFDGATEEICDDLDNNCDGRIDEGFSDTDADGVKDCADEDDDGDSIPDGNDNCPLFFDPSQSDFDNDQEGDVCDLDDGWIYVFLNEPNVVKWQEEAGYDSWNTYRNDLDYMKDTGIYTVDPAENPLARRACKRMKTYFQDIDSPTPGQAFYYLVTGMSGGIESSLGTDSAGNERPNDNPCP